MADVVDSSIREERSGVGDSSPMNIALASSHQHGSTSPKVTSGQWIQVLSTFMVFLNTWGLLLTFGVFQVFYEEELLRDVSSSDISWISTVCAFILLSGGIATGPLYDFGLYRYLLLFGSILQIFGMMMISLSTRYYQLFLSQGICVGLGASIVFTPSVAAAAAAFTDNATRSKMMGLMATGSSIGGIIYPVMFRSLIGQIGFPWTIRSIAFVALALYLVSYLVLMEKFKRKSTIRRVIDTSAFTDLPFMTMSIASLFSATAFYIPLLYLPLITQSRVPTIDPDLVFYLLAILNGSSIPGRIAVGFIAAHFGPTESILGAAISGCILLFCWIVVDTVAGTIVWTVFWGIIAGVLVTLPGAIIPLFSPSLAVIGTRSGMLWAFIGAGILIGSPIAGAIYDPGPHGNHHLGLQIFAGMFMMGAAIMTLYPVMHLRRTSKARLNR